MNVFGLGVDTSLQCFIAAEEMGISEERGRADSATAWILQCRLYYIDYIAPASVRDGTVGTSIQKSVCQFATVPALSTLHGFPVISFISPF